MTHSITVKCQINGSDYEIETLEITSIEDDGAWIDRAKNPMDYTIGGGVNLPPVKNDCTGPVIETVNSSSNDGNYGLGATIPITIIFDEEVVLDPDYTINVFLDAKEADPLEISAFTVESDKSQGEATYTVEATQTSIGKGASNFLEVTEIQINPVEMAFLTDAVDYWKNPVIAGWNDPDNNKN